MSDEDAFDHFPNKKSSVVSRVLNIYTLVFFFPISVATMYINLLIIKYMFDLEFIEPFWHALILSPFVSIALNLVSSSCNNFGFLKSKNFKKEETVLKRQIAIVGSNLTTDGSLTVPSLKIAGGNASIAGTLRVEKKLEISGSLKVKDDLISDGKCKINGHCSVGQTITGKVFAVYGTTEAESISGETIKLNGTMKIRGEIRASKSIELAIRKEDSLNIEGIIVAPEVIIRKKRMSLSGLMLKMLGLGKKYHPTIILSDIEIETEKLTLIDVEIDDSEEFVQKQI
ncbi:MAG: hypothetical protein ACTSYA_05835 [Candidatus Kariarchaeaceae archaeon]